MATRAGISAEISISLSSHSHCLGQSPVRQLPLHSWMVWVYLPNRTARTCLSASVWRLHKQVWKPGMGHVSPPQIKNPNTFLISSPWKMDISKFAFHGTSLTSTRTEEDMLLVLKMPVFLRKGGRNILNIYWIVKIHHKGDFSSTAMLSFSCH